MNIAFVHPELLLGGSEKVSYDTANYLSQTMGVKSFFIVRRTNAHAEQCLSDIGATVLYLPEEQEEVFSACNLEAIQSYIRSHQVEMIFVMAWINLSPEARETLPCRLVFWHHVQPLNECEERIFRTRVRAERWLRNWPDYWLALLRYRIFPWRRRKIQRRLREQIALADYYFVLCPEYRERMIRELALSPPEADKILPMINTQEGVGTPRLDKEREIIYMGRLERGQKRVDRLLRVWAKVQEQLPEWRLRIYGSGDDEAYLRSLAHDLKLARCTFEGRIQYPATAYERAAVLCMTSSYEGYPLALVEAQSHGTIPIAFDACGGIRHIIGEGNRAGILVEAFDLDAYATSLVVLCRDETLRSKLQKACLDKLGDYAPTINDHYWQRVLGLSGDTPMQT